jgi:hypothetical protein
LPPAVESLVHFLTVFGGGQVMPAWAEVSRDRAIRGKEALRIAGGFKPLHPALSLAGGLVRILDAVVEIAMLPMFHTRQHLTLGGAVALKLIRDDHPGHILAAFQQLPEAWSSRPSGHAEAGPRCPAYS